jgi:cytochrome c oxidase subunit 1
MSTQVIALPATTTHRRPLIDTLHDWVTTVDHKRIGILYIVFALSFLLIRGIEASMMRIQLMRANMEFVSPQVFNRLFTMHGTTMIFFFACRLCSDWPTTLSR